MFKIMWQVCMDKPRAVFATDNEVEAREKAEAYNSALDDEDEEYYYVEEEV